MEKNDLIDFFHTSWHEMQSEYERISRESKKDSGTAGDEVEENWAKFLREWLPSYYHIVTKGKILFENGFSSPQVDVIILSPDYPRGLIEKCKKKYLSCGVVAAFECKLTLRGENIIKFFQNSVDITKNTFCKDGTPYKELHRPFIYGLLAHTHDYKLRKRPPEILIEKQIIKYDGLKVHHPKEMPDLICVSDLGIWTAFKQAYLGPSFVKKSTLDKISHDYDVKECVQTTYILLHKKFWVHPQN